MRIITFNEHRLTIEDIYSIARKHAQVVLDKKQSYITKINDGYKFLDRMLKDKDAIYGVNTGYGDSCTRVVPMDRYDELPIHLIHFHGCGMGEYFDDQTTRGIIASRLKSLCIGYSGVSYSLLESLVALIQNDILPRIPQEGSVGASGDLTPLSYVGAVLLGERDVLYEGKIVSAHEALQRCNLKPLVLKPKEALAIMNGTSAMTAIACLAFKRAEYLAGMATKITSMASLALMGNTYHFDTKLFSVKHHQGQMLTAKRIFQDLGGRSETGIIPARLQDPYSIRCAPHVIGIFYDAAPMLSQLIENELNSVNDNPIVDPQSESIMHGGHFYGGHVAFAMDSLKNIIANIADLMDRQLALLVDEKFNRGLPPNLSGSLDKFSLNHGFKAVQIGVSAWTAEALKGTMPASVFSRSTECHNQDKVSMGTIAARDCIRILELSEQVGAACLLAMVQALDIRLKKGEIRPDDLKPLQTLLDQVHDDFEFLSEDRPLENDLRKTLAKIRDQYWIFDYHEWKPLGYGIQ